MATAFELYQQRQTQDIWESCCGFVQLTLPQFMEIQERLLLEQIQLLSRCTLGREVMGERMPQSVAEFRQQVPLTTYERYAPYFLEQCDDVLPVRPAFWMRTSGPTGLYRYKWVPMPEALWYDEASKAFLGSLMFACSIDQGEFPFEPGDRLLYTMAPRPYITGWGGTALLKEFPFHLLPSEEEAEKLSYEERVEEGFYRALDEGLDAFFGLSSVLVSIGERFSQKARHVSSRARLLRPRILWRLALGLVKSRLAGRPLLPRDLWQVKGIVTAGIDTAVFKDRIAYLWGKRPLEIYAGTDILLVAVQTADDEGLTFVPNFSFLEFIPEAEGERSRETPGYQPQTLLIDEVEVGQLYELVVTHFRGGGLIRYRSGDIIRIVATGKPGGKTQIPQMAFESRAADVIDLAGFTRLTERVLWQAIEQSGFPYQDWVVRKEIKKNQPILHLYLEPKEAGLDPISLADLVHQQLRLLDEDYNDLEEIASIRPLHMTLLAPGSFRRYVAEQRRSGADLDRLKPPHLNPPEEVIQRLLSPGLAVAGV
ncbi:MAG: GH3 auxin-responsive promoter family protein [Chloroflexi bacterium]|nr:GH3 auxin-responsive promoter family protein [Chloroflexota bacterium]